MSRFVIHQSDPNQEELVKYMRGIGASVDIIHRPTDLSVGFRGLTVLVEVKIPKKKIKFTRAQKIWWEKDYAGWREIIQTKRDCVKLLKKMAKVAAGAKLRSTTDSLQMPTARLP